MKRAFLGKALLPALMCALLLRLAPGAVHAEAPRQIVIETVTFGTECRDIPAVEEALNAREQVDLVMVGLTLPLSEMIAGGMLAPLDELPSSSGGDISAVFGDQLEADRLNGTLYAIPADAYTAQAGGFIYNRQMTDELGIVVPDPLNAEA